MRSPLLLSDSYGSPPSGGANVLAIISFLSGLLSLLGSGCCCVPILSLFAMFAVPVLALVAIVTGIIGMTVAARSGAGRGMSIAGILLGIGGIVAGVAIYLLSVFAFIGVAALQEAGRAM